MSDEYLARAVKFYENAKKHKYTSKNQANQLRHVSAKQAIDKKIYLDDDGYYINYKGKKVRISYRAMLGAQLRKGGFYRELPDGKESDDYMLYRNVKKLHDKAYPVKRRKSTKPRKKSAWNIFVSTFKGQKKSIKEIAQLYRAQKGQ